MNCIFGPVPSRRLGRSLGVDLAPFKTCTYDCIYCQLGRTTNKTVERREWVPLDDVLTQLEASLASRPDFITLSGSGEPTLYSRLDDLIAGIRSITDVPIAVLTNGSLLWDEDVREQLTRADVVMPTLAAGHEPMFQAVNRPHPAISFDRMLRGLIEFCDEYPGHSWLEVFLLAGHTAIDSELNRIIECVGRIRPERVQLNTATRPAVEDCAYRVEPDRLAAMASRFDPSAEVIADYRGVHAEGVFKAGRERVLDIIRRRPCSIEDIAAGLGIHRNEAVKHLEALAAEGLTEQRLSGGRLFYSGKQAQQPQNGGNHDQG